jgi:hypothetical protein
MYERGSTDVTSVPSRTREVTAAAAVSVGTSPNHGSSQHRHAAASRLAARSQAPGGLSAARDRLLRQARTP